MKGVPESSPNHATAQTKAVEYQKNLDVANQVLDKLDPIPKPKDVNRPYKISKTPLPNGTRVEIDTYNPDLSRKQCQKIAEQHLKEAGSNGQVAVHKPYYNRPLKGDMLPFCVNNLDGKGTFFNEWK